MARYGRKAQSKVRRAMHERKRGKLNPQGVVARQKALVEKEMRAA